MMSQNMVPHARKLTLLPILTIILGLSLCSFPPAQAEQPHHYMLLEEGNERFYRRAYTGEVDFYKIITHVSGGISHQQETLYFLDPPLVRTRYFHMNEGGDVWELPYLDAPEENWFLILDMPLIPGKTWGRNWGEYGQYYTRYTVEAPEIAYTIFGELMAIPIHYQTDYGGNFEEGRYWYADGYGLVHWVYSCFFCEWYIFDAVIGVDRTTWGSLKALYR